MKGSKKHSKTPMIYHEGKILAKNLYLAWGDKYQGVLMRDIWGPKIRAKTFFQSVGHDNFENK